MKKHTYTTYIAVASTLLVPAVSFAALGGVETLLKETLKVINLLIPVCLGLSLLYFFWGVGQFILHDAGNDKTREDGKKKMLWGIIALFVMFSLFGILRFIGDSLGVETGLPTGPSGTSGGGDTNVPDGDCFDCAGGF